MPSGRTVVALAYLLVGLAGVVSLRAQVPERGPATVLPPTDVEVVRIEVMVTEKRGRAKAGLKRDDFAVFEDGEPQPIVQFQAFARPAPSRQATPAPGSPEPEAAPPEDESADLLPARYVVLVIDDVHMVFESLARVRKVLVRFLDEDLRPEDQVALLTTSGSALSQEFTSDREALQRTLARLSAHGRPVEWSTIPVISEYQAELIEGGDSLALDAAVQEILSAGQFQDIASAQEQALAKSRAVFAEAVYNSRLTLEALERICRGLSSLSGRKSLFFISDGFLPGLSGGSGLGYDLRRIADAGTRAGVVVYALDTRGVVALPSTASAASLTRVGPNTAGLVESIRRRSEQATRDGMHALAEDTGGFLAESTNDLRAGLREMLRDTEAYYVLAYEPTNTRRDGRFRRIEVRLPGLKGVKVRTRSGYYAPGDRGLVAADAAGGDEARREEQRRVELRTALDSLAPLTALPVRLSADFLSLDPEVSRVVVSGSVDPSALSFVQRRDRRQATVDAIARVYDEGGGEATTLQTQRSSMDLDEADYERLLNRGLPYEKAVVVKPGRYLVRLAAREEATGRLGSAWQWVDVPDLGTGRLTLSGLFLLEEAPPADAPPADAPPATAEPPMAGGPPPADGVPPLRSAQALRRFGRDESLYVQLYAYNARRDGAGKSDLVCQPEVLLGGAVLATGAPEPMADAADPVPHVSRIRLQRFDPGEYELRVTVTDRNATALAARSVRFTVE